jgi:two-component system phosphate regulon sensor histidine kinase PhoR
MSLRLRDEGGRAGATGAVRVALAEVIEALPDPVMVLDAGGRVALLNGPAREGFGDWAIGQSHVSVLRQPRLLDPVERAYSGRRDGRGEFVHSSGEVETRFDVRISPLALADGSRPWVLLFFRDVSDMSAGESIRRDFVANVSHELRTPLTAIGGLIETLQGPAREDGVARDRFLALMAKEVGRMNRLVSDLLSLSRLEGMSRRRPSAPVDLMPLLAQAVDTLRPVAAEADVALTLRGPGTARLLGDADQLLQVASNLIENAIKYGSRPGRVELRLGVIEHEPVLRGPAWELVVADDGPGIPAEHLPRVTERFYRVDTHRSRAQGGTGLGLAIVKHIVNRHRGRLRIESAAGAGVRVRVALPRIP